MTRGNQRDLAREKNLKKQQQANKSKNAAGVSTDKRMASDAEIMRQKQQKALEKQAQSQQDAQANKVVKTDPLK